MEHSLNIYITAHTLITSLGFGIQENTEAIRACRSGIRIQGGRTDIRQPAIGRYD